ncbi:MAG: hypothetical protein ACI85O_003576 [Saprospiraceae bacterium]
MFFFLYTSLKIRAVTQAIAALFALSKEKITTLNLGRLFSTNSLTIRKNMTTNKILLPLLLIIFSLSLSAQRDYRWEKEYEPSPEIPIEFQQEDAVIIYNIEERQSRVINNAPFTRNIIKRRYKILTQKGLEIYSRFSVGRKNRMSIAILDARTRKASGEIVDLDANEIKELEYNAEKDLTDTDKSLLFSVPGVEVGDEVEIVVTYEGSTLLSGGNVFLHQKLPTLKSEFQLFVDEKIIVFNATLNGMTKPKVETPNDHYRFIWTAENLPGMYDSRSAIPGNTLPYLIYSFDYSRFYGSLPPPVPNDWRELILAITENLDLKTNSKKLDVVMKGILGDNVSAPKIEQAAIIHKYFNDNITLKRLTDNEKSGYTDTYFKNKVADWTALVSMYDAAFKWIGLNYYFGTGRSKYLGPILLSFPTDYQITDYFYAVEDENGGMHVYMPKEYSDKKWQADEVPSHLRNTRVYILNMKDKETFKQLDFENNRFNQNQMLIKGKADISLTEGTMTHTLQESINGEISMEYRDWTYDADEKEELAETIAENWKDKIPNATIKDVKLSDYPTTNPYKYKVNYKVETPEQISEIETGTYKIQFGNCLTHKVLDVRKRKRLLDYCPDYAFMEAYNYVLNFSENAAIQNKENVDIKVDNEVGTFELIVNQVKPNMLSVRSRYVIKVNSIAPDKMQLLYDLNEAAASAGSAELIVRQE